jgi:hypothetical protein
VFFKLNENVVLKKTSYAIFFLLQIIQFCLLKQEKHSFLPHNSLLSKSVFQTRKFFYLKKRAILLISLPLFAGKDQGINIRHKVSDLIGKLLSAVRLPPKLSPTQSDQIS